MVNCVYMILFYNVISDLLYMHSFVRFCLKIISRIFKMWLILLILHPNLLDDFFMYGWLCPYDFVLQPHLRSFIHGFVRAILSCNYIKDFKNVNVLVGVCIATFLGVLNMIGCVRMFLFYNLIGDLSYMDSFVRLYLVNISWILKTWMCSSEFA